MALSKKLGVYKYILRNSLDSMSSSRGQFNPLQLRLWI